MLRYAARRIALMVPTLLGVALLTFFMLRVVPGDIVEVKLRSDGAQVTQEMIDSERARLGLDRPLVVQFGDWMRGLVTLDLGTSMWTGRPVAQEIGIRLGLTMQVAFMAAVIAVLIAVPLGTISALWRDTWLDYAVRIFTMAGLAVPSFWLGMLVILGLLSVFHWSPPVTYTPFWRSPLENISQLIWPALAVGYRYAAVVARMVRSSVIEVMREDYIRTARAKGVFERLVVARHAMRNAMLPAITVVGLEFAFLIGGLVVTEQVFNLNGIGRLFVEAVSRSDFVLVQALVMLLAVVFVTMNLLIDMLYGVLDPRVRHG
ncbi:ABC transporter permease subunit [Pseudoroseomonas wenyumeiae]|uniref:ABC transporter permease n=1 Tax=Teichococcus wenyumeiae TaxID=2478470 RepID=A0A3A9JN69_9PROT|nr:ABC transporter permease [Pseudoroseomonas wenyumeiae]RKK06213.1 ABC transporter permease [Pseudoroseomonas wenyumeiae]RMI19713.1 ABC transporter permease subunit [Pseudoroseomonas wenyumeiae]